MPNRGRALGSRGVAPLPPRMDSAVSERRLVSSGQSNRGRSELETRVAQVRSPLWKKEAIAPAEPATTTTAQSSRAISTTRPAGVNGFLSCDETVSS